MKMFAVLSLGRHVYLSEDTFDLVSVPVWLDAVAESFFAEAADQIVGIIDEKHDVADVVFLGQLGENFSSDRDRIRRNQP